MVCFRAEYIDVKYVTTLLCTRKLSENANSSQISIVFEESHTLFVLAIIEGSLFIFN